MSRQEKNFVVHGLPDFFFLFVFWLLQSVKWIQRQKISWKGYSFPIWATREAGIALPFFAVLTLTGASQGARCQRMRRQMQDMKEMLLWSLDGEIPGVGNGNPLQYACLEHSMDRGAWRATVHGVTESQTWLSDFTFTVMILAMRESVWQEQDFSWLSAESLSHVHLFVTLWMAALKLPEHHQFLELAQTHAIESVMPSNHLILCHPHLLPPSIFPSNRVFSNESALCISWPMYWSFSFSISPSMNIQDWFPLGWTRWISLHSKGHSRVFSNTTAQRHQFFHAQLFLIVQLSQPYMTTGKTMVLYRWMFAGKLTSLLFNMLSRLVITFLPRSKHLLFSWVESPSAVILEPQNIKSATISTVSPSIFH